MENPAVDLAVDPAAEAASINKTDQSKTSTTSQPSPASSPLAVTVGPTSTLERLPSELRRQILFSIADLEDLRALVLASPVYYQQHLLDRRALLEGALSRTLGSVLADSLAVQESRERFESSARLPESETISVKGYDWPPQWATSSEILEGCSEKDLVAMARFYLTIAQPLVLNCAALFLWNLDESLEDCALSDTERTRFLRALYRF
ncbi:hypothetical protein C8A05DRAFT_30772 [Staphylotrichum tortipilum]|uniref:Uncharacterized protein n=1 Tax=Staphylotrichum tortipilum TaxID=2831512 RepID=A0AAN6MS59_9PEZI|nr:hypothetical protein C8A05DRAFT_30772 [Staphylotrichum longicolle]